MNELKFNLKDKVTDSVTGLSGTITAAAIYITRQPCYLLETSDSTGRPIEWWVDEDRLVKLS